MKTLGLSILTAVLLLATPSAFAGPWKTQFQDQKLPSQVMLEHYQWVNPAVGSATLLKNAQALNNGSTTTISTFSAQPDFARNIVLTTGGTTASIGAGTAVVSGTNIFGKAISENFTISATQNGATTGNKAFKTVTSVVFPATTGASATVSVGSGNKLGLNRCSDRAGDYVFSEFNGAYETTRGTYAVSSSVVDSNTFTPNGTMDATKNVDLFYVQNFRCFGF